MNAVLLWSRRIVALACVLLVLGALVVWLVLRRYEQDLPSTQELRDYRPPQVTRVLARDGSVLAELFVERRTVVSIADIPETMRVAALAAEDADFYRHEGLDYLGMLRALVVNVRSGRMKQGGSTITQQVVKNALLSPDRTFARKAREVLLARRIEQELTKDEILELYLNHIYFGHGRWGVEEASRYYFGKGVASLTLAEAALIAGLPKGPSLYSPRVDVAKARARRDAVLDQIALKAFATPEQVDVAKAEAIALAPAAEALPELAPEVVDEVERRLRDIVGPGASRGGYTVHTTLDPELQAAARRAIRTNLDAFAERQKLLPPLKKTSSPRRVPFQGTPTAKGHHVYLAVVTSADDKTGVLRLRVGTAEGVARLTETRRYNPRSLSPTQFAEVGALVRVSAVAERNVGDDGVPREFRLELGPESALVTLDVASREIRAMVGSYAAVRATLDRASHAKRQPGSAFKPFVYSYAIHSRRLTAASVVQAAAPPSPIPPPAGGVSEPLRMRDAIARSVNDAAVWTLREIGPENVVGWAHAMGIESDMDPTESLALGAYEVTPRELASAYATLASGGIHESPILITRITGPDGADIELPSAPPRRRVLDEAEAYVVTSLLTSVIQSGTGRGARGLRLPLAGKTGTSNESKDAWFAGYTTDLVTVVWTGYDDAVSLGKGESGASAALPAFVELMKSAYATRKPLPFSTPAGVKRVAIDPASGLLPYEGQEDVLDEVFLAGTEPTETAVPPDSGTGGAGGADDTTASQASLARAGGGGASPPPATPEPQPPF